MPRRHGNPRIRRRCTEAAAVDERLGVTTHCAGIHGPAIGHGAAQQPGAGLLERLKPAGAWRVGVGVGWWGGEGCDGVEKGGGVWYGAQVKSEATVDEEEMRRWIEMERIRKAFDQAMRANQQAAFGGGNSMSPHYVNPSLAGMTPAPAVEQPISVKELLARIRAGCD